MPLPARGGSVGPLGLAALGQLDLARAAGPVVVTRHRRQSRLATAVLETIRFERYQEMWGEAAQALGAEVRALSGAFLAIEKGPARTVVWHHHVQLDDPVVVTLALDKLAVEQLLGDAGVPTVDHVVVDIGDLAAGRSFLQAGGPCVVKPATGTSGGRGVIAGVAHGRDLLRAAVAAGRFDHRLLIERQVKGEEYRLLFLDGTLLDAVRRRPATVEADGRSTVAELLAEENRRRVESRGRAGMSFLRLDLDVVFAVRDAGLTFRSVPPAGAAVAVKGTASDNGRRDAATAVDVPTAVVDVARAAASTVGLRLAGVDLVVPAADPSRAVILEVNGTPGLHYHYLVADEDRARRVAEPILASLLESGAHP